MSDPRADLLTSRELRVIRAIYRYCEENPNSIGMPDEEVEIGNSAGMSRGIMVPILDDLFERSILTKRFDKRNGWHCYCLTPLALEAAENPFLGNIGDLPSQIPAADRFVGLNDNSHGLKDIRQAAEDFDVAVSSANRITGDSENDDALKLEAAGIRTMLSGSKIMLGLLAALRACVDRIKRIAIQVEAKAIEIASDRLLAVILQALGGG